MTSVLPGLTPKLPWTAEALEESGAATSVGLDEVLFEEAVDVLVTVDSQLVTGSKKPRMVEY